jgi:hypothetical protein
MTESAPIAPAETGDIVAKADRWYRGKWCIIGLAFLGGALWFLRDGYVGYEAENEKARQEAVAAGKPVPERLHSDTDIRLQRIIGFGLLPVSCFMLFRAVYSGRGEYRLSGNVLHVPGHPPVPLDSIRAIDQSKWDRKGIVYLAYEAAGTQRRLKLDDYVYERGPTDKIYDRILAAVAPAEVSAPAPGEQAEA